MQRDYEQKILEGIQQDMIKERAREKAIRLRDLENTRSVREQNDRFLEQKRQQRAKEDEETRKREEIKHKEDVIREQREQQLREVAARRTHDERMQRDYEQKILEGIQQDMIKERARA